MKVCASCTRSLTGVNYRARTGNSEFVRCFACALLQKDMLLRAAKAASVVGTVLTVLNHGDQVFRVDGWPPDLAWKVSLTYVVPFCVTLYGAMSNTRS